MTGSETISKILKEADALPFLFVGSGFTRRYLEADNWEDLLRSFALKADSSPYFYEKLRERAKATLISNGRDANSNSLLFPLIADQIEEAFNNVWYNLPVYESSRQKYSEEIRRGVSPLKMEIAQHCQKMLENEPRLDSEILLLKALSEHSIGGIITTNYDCFLEKLFPNFVPYVGQDEVMFADNHSVSEIYKIHGCCNCPESIIINSRDYGEFERKNAYLAAKLLTIFVEHPIVFIGYSLQDGNIQKILEAIIDCLSPGRLNILKNRLIFVEWSKDESEMEVSPLNISFRPGKPIEMTKIKVNDYTELYSILLQIKSKYPTKLLRRIKKDIYKLTLTTNPNEKLVALNVNQQPDDKEYEYVFGIGALEIGRLGFSMVKAEQLYHDVLFNDETSFINKFIVEETIPLLMSSCSTKLPIYKYISQYDLPLPVKYSKFAGQTYDGFLTHSLRGIRKNNPYHSVNDVLASRGKSLSYRLDHIAALNEDEVDEHELFEFLKSLFDADTDILFTSPHKSIIKKLIRIYDWKKNKR